MAVPSLQILHDRPAMGQRHEVRYRCGKCGHIGGSAAFRAGRGRHYGEHPDCSYCSGCGSAMPTWRTDWQRVEVGA